MIEFSHDGVKDSLTQLAAPTLFYEALRLSLARAQRQNEEITLVRFVLVPSQHPKSPSRYEEAVLHFAEILSAQVRADEVCARMGQLEFVGILHGGTLAAARLIERIKFVWNNHSHGAAEFATDFELRSGSALADPAESILQLLDRLDNSLSS